MSFPNDLLEQARHLANREPKRPKQASLRRAVSTAYYALFHLAEHRNREELEQASGAFRLRENARPWTDG